MIMPQNTDIDALNIDSRDFVDEFTSKPSGKFDNSSGGKIYLFKEGEKVANRGNTKFDIVLSDLAVDPFTSYSVYMVVKDRSGNLSVIANDLIADDSKPPLIGDIQVTPKERNRGNQEKRLLISHLTLMKKVLYIMLHYQNIRKIQLAVCLS